MLSRELGPAALVILKGLFLVAINAVLVRVVGAPCYDFCGAQYYPFNECQVPPLNGPNSINFTWTGDTTSTADNSDLLTEFTRIGEACSPDLKSNDFGLRFKPPFSGLFWIDTNGSTYDTILTLIDCSTGRITKCDDDGGSTRDSFLSARLEKDRKYLILVDGYTRADEGTVKLRLASVSWPEDETCPGIDRFEESALPSVANVPNTLYASISPQEMVQKINTTCCDSWENSTFPGDNVTSFENAFSEITGVVAPVTGLYDILVCPPTVNLVPYICGEAGFNGADFNTSLNDTSLNDTNIPTLPSCSAEYTSIFLNEGDYLALASLHSQSPNDDLQTNHFVYATLNRSESHPNLCSSCRTPVVQSTESNPNGRGEYILGTHETASLNETNVANTYFFNPVISGRYRFSICGAVNGQAHLLTCDGTTLASANIGKVLTFNATARRLYVLQVVGSTERDRGKISIELASSLVKDDCIEDFVRNIPGRPGYVGEIGVSAFITAVYGFVMVICFCTLLVQCRPSSLQWEFRRSGAAVALCFSTSGFVISFSFTLALVYSTPAPSLGYLQLFWIATGLLGFMALSAKYLGGSEWSYATGPELFYSDNESVVKLNLGVGLFAMCVFMAIAGASFGAFFALQQNEPPYFTFCSYENELCFAPMTGTIIQRIYSQYTNIVDANGVILWEEFIPHITYDFISRSNKLSNSTHYMCALKEEEKEPTVLELCENNCESSTNGVCNEGELDCNFGNDCDDCGRRLQTTTLRLVRCSKWDQPAVFWGSETEFAQRIALPFVYTLVITIFGVFLVVRVSAALCSNPERSGSVSSEEASHEDENGEHDEDVDVAMVRIEDDLA